MEYGESREVVPVGGGIPVAKFYFYDLHKRMNFKEMVDLLRQMEIKSKEDFHQRVCDCPVCKELIGSDVLNDFQEAYGKTKPSTFQRGKTLVTMSFSTTETKERSLSHYLFNKRKEFEAVTQKPLPELINELETAYATYKGIADMETIQHLEEWRQALLEQEAPDTAA